MARTQLNSALTGLRGQIGDLVFKQYKYGTVVTRVPRMSNVKPSKKQLEHRQRVKAAAQFYRAAMNDPELKRRFESIAKKKGWPLSAVALREYFRRRGAA
jgi:hypothetical protein